MVENKVVKKQSKSALDKFKLRYEKLPNEGKHSGKAPRTPNKLLLAIRNFFQNIWLAVKQIMKEIM